MFIVLSSDGDGRNGFSRWNSSPNVICHLRVSEFSLSALRGDGDWPLDVAVYFPFNSPRNAYVSRAKYKHPNYLGVF